MPRRRWALIAAVVGAACFSDSNPSSSGETSETSGDPGTTSTGLESSTTGTAETSTGLASLDSTSSGDDTGTGTDTDSNQPPDPYAPWSDPQPVPGINSDADDDDPFLSQNLLNLYFGSKRRNEADMSIDEDIFVATRDTPDSQFGAPERLSATINTSFADGNPHISGDETTLFFTRNEGELGLYVAFRGAPGTPFMAASAIAELDEPARPEFAPAVSDDLLTIVFARDLGQTVSLFTAERSNTDAEWGPAELIVELESEGQNTTPWINADATVMMFASSRPGGVGGTDIWVTTRELSEQWETPVLAEGINTVAEEQDPAVSSDGRTLFYASGTDSENLDIWYATR